jgi:hypothetical protein
MQRSPIGFSLRLFFALLAIGLPGIAAAQDMPPVLAPLAPPPAALPSPPPSPVATAIIPVAVAPPAPAKKPRVVAAAHPAPAHHRIKTAALNKRLAVAHQHVVTHHVALRRAEPRYSTVAEAVPEPSIPFGTAVPPPGYYGPGPRERLVYGGPPPGVYGGWGGYRGRNPYYP